MWGCFRICIAIQEAKVLLERFIIGRVKPGGSKAQKKQQPAVVTAAAGDDPSKPLVALQHPTERYALPLAEKKQLNPDTFFMRFALPTPKHRYGDVYKNFCFHLFNFRVQPFNFRLFPDINGEPVVRAYTPISGDRDLGVLDFLIKVYWSDQNPLYPQGGKMTQHLANMEVGDTIDVKGPYGKFTYEGHGQYNLNRCSLIYANKHEEDIWLRQELDAMARANPDRFHLWVVVPGLAAMGYKPEQMVVF
eukprot:gene9493-9656_t